MSDLLGGSIYGLFDVFQESSDRAMRVQQLETTVAELVSLLRMGQELKDAAYDEGQYAMYDPPQSKESRVESLRIIALYNAAIAKHGGA